MILPLPRASIARPISRASRNWAVRSTSSTPSQSASVSCSAGTRTMMPALLTRMSGQSSAVIALGERRHRLPVGQIQPVGRTAATERGHPALHLAAGRLLGRADGDDVGPGGRQRLGHGQADPASGTGDDGGPALEGEQSAHRAPPWQSTRIFITPPPALSAPNASATASSRTVRVIRADTGTTPSATSSTARSKSARW